MLSHVPLLLLLPAGITLNVPGVPFAVPLHAAQTIAAFLMDAGLMGWHTANCSFVHADADAAGSDGPAVNQPQQQLQRARVQLRQTRDRE